MSLPTKGWVNKNGTKDRQASGSFKQEYIREKGFWPKYCSVDGCYDEATDGSHMYCRNAQTQEEYIVPLCHRHNMSTSELTLKDQTKLLKVNK